MASQVDLDGRLALSIAETATALGLSRRTVERCLSDGLLPSARIGARRRVVPVAALRALLSRADGRTQRSD